MNLASAIPELDFSKFEEMGNDLLPRLSALRDMAPIYWSATEQGWIVTGHEEVLEGFRGNLPLSAARHKLFEFLVPDPAVRDRLFHHILEIFPSFLINLDPPEQARVRKLLLKAFSRKVVEQYRPFAVEVIQETLDKVKGRTSVEFVDEIARSITGRTILRIMGLQDEATYLPKLERWAYLVTTGLSIGLSGHLDEDLIRQTDDVFREMGEVLLNETQKRRKHPTGDFISMLVESREGDDFLSDREIVGTLCLVLIAGHDTTLNTMALSIAELSKRPDACQHMLDHPENMLNASMELMRHVAMSTQMFRIVAEDFEWKGRQLKRGQLVHLMIAGANRDPHVFPDPDRLDLDRAQDGNMTFAPGLHHCIGHLFAKMQLTEFFPEFLKRYDSFEMLDDSLKFGGSVSFRGLSRLDLNLHARES